MVLGDQAESHGVRQRLRRWLWCGVFGEMYGGSTETRFAYDVPDLIEWAVGGDREPRTTTEAQFQAERLLTLRSGNSAAYKGLYALQMKRGGRDFRTGESIDVHAYFDDAIDIHHIFPQRWCRENGIEDGLMNCVVNKTAIDAHTNRRIGGNAPSRYIARLEAQDGIDHAEFDAILQSHDIDPIALRQDDFPQFFDRRFERLLKQIEEAMGKSVNRSADRADNPYAELHDDAGRVQAGVESLISGGESKVVEFKSTGRRNLRTNEKDAAIEWAVVKSIAGFMNAHGGTLLVGVSDDEQIVGIERDYAFLRKGDRDGWELWFTGLIASALGKVAASELEVSFADVDGGTVARIDVGPASKPVFAMPSKGERKEQFLVRINNSTQELLGRDALDYQQKRWPS